MPSKYNLGQMIVNIINQLLLKSESAVQINDTAIKNVFLSKKSFTVV